MVYILTAIFIIGITLLFYLLYDLKRVYKNQIDENSIKEIEARDIEQSILIEIAKYEKFLFKKGFVRRNILSAGKVKSNVKNYKFYYYNVVDGIHAFLEVYKISNNIAVNYFFITLYKSQNYTVSTRFVKQLEKDKRDGIYVHKHTNLDIKELYLMHNIDREKQNETILKKRLSILQLLKLPIFIKSLNIKSKKNRENKQIIKRSSQYMPKISHLFNPLDRVVHIG